MRRGIVHKLCQRRERSKRDESERYLSFEAWKRDRWRVAYYLACQPSVSPPGGESGYTDNWSTVTCPACIATRPKLGIV